MVVGEHGSELFRCGIELGRARGELRSLQESDDLHERPEQLICTGLEAGHLHERPEQLICTGLE